MAGEGESSVPSPKVPSPPLKVHVAGGASGVPSPTGAHYAGNQHDSVFVVRLRGSVGGPVPVWSEMWSVGDVYACAWKLIKARERVEKGAEAFPSAQTEAIRNRLTAWAVPAEGDRYQVRRGIGGSAQVVLTTAKGEKDIADVFPSTSPESFPVPVKGQFKAGELKALDGQDPLGLTFFEKIGAFLTPTG